MTSEKAGIFRNLVLNWLVCIRSSRFRKNTLKSREKPYLYPNYAKWYLYPAVDLYVASRQPFLVTTRQILLAFQQMVPCGQGGGAACRRLDGRIFQIFSERNFLERLVSSLSSLREAIPDDHSRDVQVKELLACLSGDFTQEEEVKSRSSSVESDPTMDPSSPYNKLYGGARQLGGVAPSITWESVKEYYLAYSHKPPSR